MGSLDNRFRKKWQDYCGMNAAGAEMNFYEVFQTLFEGTEYEIERKPKCFKNIYLKVRLPKAEREAIYTPPTPIKRHGLEPDCLIRNTRTNKTMYVELKRQDGWVEGKKRNAGRGNAHERLSKYFTPGLMKLFREEGGIKRCYLPFWIVFQGDITRDPCRVREITFWFDRYKGNYFFWRDASDIHPVINHFEKYIVPMLE